MVARFAPATTLLIGADASDLASYLVELYTQLKPKRIIEAYSRCLPVVARDFSGGFLDRSYPPMNLSIQDKFLQQDGTVFLTGMEAIVRLLLEKQRRDQSKGQVNQTYVSGYEGSPLGGLDLKVVEQLDLLNQLGRTVHQFGINEKTAASAMLGTQYAASGDVDAFWYGKAHGTMWIPDEIWLANLAGTGARGAMVLLTGEDHRSKSSVSPGTSDWVLRSSMVPIFYPSSIEDIIRLGIHAIALSRYTGVVTALKLVTPVCDGASTVDLEVAKGQILLPDKPDGNPYQKSFNPIVMATGALPMQRELLERKWPLVEEYVRLNQLNRIVDRDAGGKIGIVATGKSYTDLRQALDAMGVRVPVLHLSVSYPLDTEIVRDFAHGLRRVYVVEEPGPFVEEGIRAALLGTGVEGVWGQYDESGALFIPAYSEVDPEVLARVLWPKLKESAGRNLLGDLNGILERPYPAVPTVTPMSCGGCPYNSFRDLKEKPGGAIGCSSIRAIEAYDYGVLYIPTMGAGGSIYSGWAQFNGNQHIFQYLGDGSYFHSGRGAIQSCVQGGVNITFLLLYNGVVALTGGQNPGGQRPVPDVVQELFGIGVKLIGIVSEEPGRYADLQQSQVKVYGMEGHAEALEYFKEVEGTTVLILDKECATEKNRRKRRQGLKPEKYILINEEICEGCGDCYQQSEGCAALYNVETEFGDKTQVRQANCTQDELCVDGECPSFMTVVPAKGVGLRRRRPEPLEDLPEPRKKELQESYTIFAMGRGGTGVVTISHLLAYAAMIEGKYVYLSNNTGLAQKGGPVEAPIVLSANRQPVFNRLFPGGVDLYLGFDLLRAAETQNLNYAAPDRSTALISTTKVPNARINRHQDERFPDPARLRELIDSYTSKSENVYLDTYWLAEKLFADILYANMLLLGAAYQAGTIPLRAASIEAAIELNDKGVENNIQAFRWGRLAVADPTALERALGRQERGPEEIIEVNRGHLQNHPGRLQLHEEALGEIKLDPEWRRRLSVRLCDLCEYQDLGYARAYLDVVSRVWQREQDFPDRGFQLTRAVIFNLYKLMAYKDEYEVARLATRTAYMKDLNQLFDGPSKVFYRFNPPNMRWLGLGKLKLGPWSRPFLKLLVRLRRLRGTRFDPFAFTSCRRLERALIDWYQNLIEEVLEGVEEENYAVAVKILNSADGIRGYEDIKEKSAARIQQDVQSLLEQLAVGRERNPTASNR